MKNVTVFLIKFFKILADASKIVKTGLKTLSVAYLIRHTNDGRASGKSFICIGLSADSAVTFLSALFLRNFLHFFHRYYKKSVTNPPFLDYTYSE